MSEFFPEQFQVGIDLGGTKIEIAVLSASGEIVFRERLPTPQQDYTATIASIKQLFVLAEEFLQCKIASLGIGTPGSRSNLNGNMKNCNSTCLNGRPLLSDLQAALNIPVVLANDANCFALSEAVDGAASHGQMVFGVILGTGVGGALVYQQQTIQGQHNIAGEWGHNKMPLLDGVFLEDRLCYCGRKNCIETFLSGPGLSQTLHELSGLSYSAKVMADIYQQKMNVDVSVLESVNNAMTIYFKQLALALSQIINVLDPDVIVLGGGVSNIDVIYQQIPKLWSKSVFNDEVNTQLVKAKFGDSSGVRGAAWLTKKP